MSNGRDYGVSRRGHAPSIGFNRPFPCLTPPGFEKTRRPASGL